MSIPLLAAFVAEMNQGAAPIPPISLVATSTSTTVQASNTVILDVPSGTQNNDLLLALIQSFSDTSGSITTPVGWTLIDDGGPSISQSFLFSRVASSEPASYTFASSSSSLTAVAACMINLRYVDSVTPIDQHSTSATAGTSHTTPVLTPTRPDSLILGGFSTGGNFSTTIVSPAVEYIHANSSNSSCAFGGVTQSAPTAQSVTGTTPSSIVVRGYALAINHI